MIRIPTGLGFEERRLSDLASIKAAIVQNFDTRRFVEAAQEYFNQELTVANYRDLVNRSRQHIFYRTGELPDPAGLYWTLLGSRKIALIVWVGEHAPWYTGKQAQEVRLIYKKEDENYVCRGHGFNASCRIAESWRTREIRKFTEYFLNFSTLTTTTDCNALVGDLSYNIVDRASIGPRKEERDFLLSGSLLRLV